jgi:hypothetical protein
MRFPEKEYSFVDIKDIRQSTEMAREKRKAIEESKSDVKRHQGVKVFLVLKY